ncbi:MAG TPA: nuclear transport factor 2 family protein [Solirubrobacteraceae bacterium]|nr:nuclear transport factor 2 family protein [Solirubrobacteraceae bacterium]
MSAENVELVKSLQMGPDVDVASFLEDDEAVARLRDAIACSFDPLVQCTMRFPGIPPVTYPGGLDGLHAAWRDWLRQWESYRVEVEDVLDCGEQVIVALRVQGRRTPRSPETTHRRATVWTVREERVVSVDFNVPYDEAIASAQATAS